MKKPFPMNATEKLFYSLAFVAMLAALSSDNIYVKMAAYIVLASTVYVVISLVINVLNILNEEESDDEQV